MLHPCTPCWVESSPVQKYWRRACQKSAERTLLRPIRILPPTRFGGVNTAARDGVVAWPSSERLRSLGEWQPGFYPYDAGLRDDVREFCRKQLLTNL